MVPRPQFSPSERSFIYKLYTVHSTGRRNTRFLNIRRDFTVKFPQSRVPSKQAVQDIVKKFDTSSTVHNLNSKKSPGNTYSGRPRTVLTNATIMAVSRILQRDKLKVMDDPSVNTCRSNILGLNKSSFSRY